MKKFVLVDVSSMFFRAYYAIRPLSSPSGLPTNAIYGLLAMTVKLMKQEHPDYLAFCYDRKEPSFRKQIYPEYKAHRTEMPEDLVPQIPYIKKMADVLGIPSLEVADFEADDLIGTLTKLGRRKDCDVLIVSGDKDFGQLIEPHVTLYDTMKEIKYDAKSAFEKWGVRPDQMIDYLALIGDASDNIPGIAGVGPKTAQKLLADFETLDGVYKNLDKVKGAVQEKLRTGKDEAYLSQRLVKIVTDVQVPDALANYEVRTVDKVKLGEMLGELNFKNMEKQLSDWPYGSSSESGGVKSLPEVHAKATGPANKVSNDFSVQDLDPLEAKKFFQKGQTLWGFCSEHGIFLGDEKAKIVYACRGEALAWGQALWPLEIRWKGYDLKSYWHAIKHPIARPKIDWDSQLAAYLIKSGESMEFDRVVTRFTGELPLELNFPGELFARHLALEKSLREKIDQIQATKVLTEIELPLAPILFEMEVRGVLLDLQALKLQSQELAVELKAVESQVHQLAGENFNIASPKQLGHILFEKMKLPSGKKTKTGFSTDNEVLEDLRSQSPIADAVLLYRELAKLRSTYVDALPLLVKEDGRLHTTFNQALTATGRLSSTDPNLQNIPIKTERGERVRRAFTAAPGKMLLSVDYSQIELRILAHYSADVNLGKAFQDDLDVHSATAAEIFNIKLAEVTSAQRRIAKAVNFGIAYGQGAFGLAETLGIARGEASEIISRYFQRFPGVREYIDGTIEIAKRQGYVETLYGRRRYVDELKGGSPALRKFGERAAINAPIQGTASDIVKLAMIKVVAEVPLAMTLQVHDELIFEASEDSIAEFMPKVIRIMETIAQLKVPLKANAAVGTNWDAAH